MDLFEIASAVKRRHGESKCPCCGQVLGYTWEVGSGGETINDVEIAAGIKFCGLCVYKGHHREASFVAGIILAIKVPQSRKPV